jgi:hypothetical protein
VVGVGWQASALARPLEGPRGAVIATSSSILAPGGPLTVTGQNFVPDELITLTLYSQGVTIGSTASNGGGSFSTAVTIPADTAPGSHTIVATGATGDSANTGITIVSTQTPPVIAALTPPALIPPAPSTAGSNSLPPKTLQLSRITLVPGQQTIMSGRGCAPGATVFVSINGKDVGQLTANSEGAFSTSLTPFDQGVGQVTVTARCGSKSFVAIANLVSTAKVSAPEGSVAVGGGFVLLGGVLVRGQFGSSASRRRRRRRSVDTGGE